MRRIVVALTVCVITVSAVSFVGYCKAQSSIKKFGETTGKAADEARAVVWQLEKEKVPVKGNLALADFFAKGEDDDVLIINGDGSLISKADHLAMWRSGVMKQQSESQADYKIDVYDNGNVAVLTYINTIHLTHDGVPLIHVSRIWNVLVKQDGNWQVVIHGVSRKGA